MPWAIDNHHLVAQLALDFIHEKPSTPSPVKLLYPQGPSLQEKCVLLAASAANLRQTSGSKRTQ